MLQALHENEVMAGDKRDQRRSQTFFEGKDLPNHTRKQPYNDFDL